MVQFETRDIVGHDDFELGIQRQNPLRYHIAHDDTKELQGIVVCIPGFGDDASVAYQKKLMKHIATEYGFLGVFMEYHALFSRLAEFKESAKVVFSSVDTEMLIKLVSELGIKLNEDDLSVPNIIKQVHIHLEKLKNIDALEKQFQLPMWATLLPYKGEYQNFGVLQALDILSVLYDLKKTDFGILFGGKPIVSLGSSHGGYLANLLMKFAPNTFDLVLDNSCYTKPPLKYIIGFETNMHKAEFFVKYPSIYLHLFVLTNWTTRKGDKNEFDASAYEIRDLTDKQ